LRAASKGFSARLDVAGDVLDHDDRVVDTNPRRPMVVREFPMQGRGYEAVAEDLHQPSADERQRYGDAGESPPRTFRRKEEDDGTTRPM